MGMILVIIVMAAAMLWLGLMGHERAKDCNDEVGGKLVLPAIIAPIFGFAVFMLACNVGGELLGMLAAVAVYFGILHYFLMDAVRANRNKIAQLERKIDQLAELLVEENRGN